MFDFTLCVFLTKIVYFLLFMYCANPGYFVFLIHIRSRAIDRQGEREIKEDIQKEIQEISYFLINGKCLRGSYREKPFYGRKSACEHVEPAQQWWRRES